MIVHTLVGALLAIVLLLTGSAGSTPTQDADAPVGTDTPAVMSPA